MENDANIKSSTATGGIKHDSGKARLELISAVATVQKAWVYTAGAEKYGQDNWRKGIAWSRVIGACLRHITAWMMGEDKDLESGSSHLAHAAVCLDFLLEFEHTHSELDDRFKIDKCLPPGPFKDKCMSCSSVHVIGTMCPKCFND